jgi:O-antigen/teichoic acid export membrane protein
MSLHQMARRLGWGVADQAVSSVSNVLVSLVAAHALGAHRFGAFSLAFVTYAVVLNASRGLATDPLLVRFSGATVGRWRDAVAGATATAIAVGLACGGGCVLLGLILPGYVGQAFLALGVGLPVLTLQDSWRFAFFAAGRGKHALVLDLIWTVLLLGGLLALVLAHAEGVAACLLVFGASAVPSAAYGLLLSGVRPRPGRVVSWVRDHQRLGARYLIENIAVGFSRQLRIIAVGAAAGLAAVGTVRAAEILMGPFLVILMGIAQVAVPEASEVLRSAPRRLGRFCLLIGGVQAGVAALWGATMLVVLPLGIGRLLLGEDVWHGTLPLVVPCTLGVMLGCLSSGATSGVRALGASPRSLLAQLTASSLYVVGGGAGAFLGGAVGSSWGWAMAGAAGVGVWWWQLRRAIAEHTPEPVDVTPPAAVGAV